MRGADTERIRTLGHDRLTTYGIGEEHTHAEWTSIARQLIHRGYLVQDIANYSVLKLTPQALPLLRGEVLLELAVPRTREKPVKKKTPKVEPVALDENELRLFETLREIRKHLAEEANVPPYVIFGDATLVEICRSQGRLLSEEFLEITGVGQVKLERYGEIFLETVAIGMNLAREKRYPIKRRRLAPFRTGSRLPCALIIGSRKMMVLKAANRLRFPLLGCVIFMM